jgi:hypothetical protein
VDTAKQRQKFQLPGPCLSGPTNLFIYFWDDISNVSNHRTNERKSQFFEKEKPSAVIKEIYYIQVYEPPGICGATPEQYLVRI